MKKWFLLVVTVMLFSGCNKINLKKDNAETNSDPDTGSIVDDQKLIDKEASPGAAKTTLGVVTGKTETFDLEMNNFTFGSDEIRVRLGDKVVINLVNKKGTHDFVLDEYKIKTETIPGGQTKKVEFLADKKGSFEYYCSIGAHRSMGMKGMLVVE